MYDSTPTGFDKNNVTLGGTTYDSEKKTGGTKITNLARGTEDSDAVNFSQLKEVASKATAAKTTVTAGKNIAVNGTSDENGSAYTVALADDVSLGNNAAIQLKGSNGSISATSGKSSLNFDDKGLSLSNGKDSTVINGKQATFGGIELNAESGTSTIRGLSNTTTQYDGFATAGRAATEEQLKEVAGQAGKAIETASKGWYLTTNKGTATNIAPGGTVDFSRGNDNLLISNDGANLLFSLSDNLDLTNNKDKKGSVKVGENTTLTDGLLRVGTDVSLTASALNVGKSSLTTSALTVGGSTYINSSGINANGNRITGVAAGIEPMDAVNVSQLYKTNQAVIANAENINSLSHSLNKLDSRINRVGAGAAALAALHPLDFDPDNKWDFAAGYGNYAGANAVAIGTYYRPNENTMFSIGGSFGGGENMINAGVSFKLGSGGSGITTSKTVMAKKIKEQDELLKAQDAKMKEQDEKIAKLEALVAQQGEMIQQALGKK
jgi:autotransporter adhesin